MLKSATVPAAQRHAAEVVVIGHGLVGSVAARVLADAGARVLLVDAGSGLSANAGTHVRNLPACREDRVFYHELVRTFLRPVSTTRPTNDLPSRQFPAMADGRAWNSAQRARVNMPAARVTNLLGGMGTLWNCVAPRLREIEHWAGITSSDWNHLYDQAEQLLRVTTDPGGKSPRQDFVLRSLAGYAAASAPVAAEQVRPDSPLLRWTGPAEILGGVADVLPNHGVRRLMHRGGRVASAEAVDLDTGELVSIEADVFMVATGGIRTPALLWASGILADEKSPLGRYLCDHPLSYGQVVLDPDALGTERQMADPVAIIPLDDERPFHALLLCGSYDAALLEGRVDERLILSLFWYSLSEPLATNRVRFRQDVTDAIGLPQPTFEYALSEADQAARDVALEDLRGAAERLGDFLPTGKPRHLSAGSSMHVMGTTRMGTVNDGRSVVDTYGRVWQFENLYLGGTGLIPSATATNPSLAACALAVRTAASISGR